MNWLNITMTIENGKEPSDNDTNALKQNDMVKHDHDDIDEHENDNTNYIGIVKRPRTALDFGFLQEQVPGTEDNDLIKNTIKLTFKQLLHILKSFPDLKRLLERLLLKS